MEAVETAVSPTWQVPRLDSERRVITGTAAGIAREIGIDPVYVRVAFAILAVAGGWGAVLYLAAWLVLNITTRDQHEPYEPIPKGATPTHRLVGFAMVAGGLLVAASSLSNTFLDSLVLPAALLGAGIAIAFDRSDSDSIRKISDIYDGGFSFRPAIGLVFVIAGIIVAATLNLSFWEASRGLLVAALVLGGTLLVLAPWITKLIRDLGYERRLRIRANERADIAAHLHDSVLQTLTLIQKQSADTTVVGLARRQERELRNWLFEQSAEQLGFRKQLENVLADVEERYSIPVEIVVVGDAEVNVDVEALLAATGEAAVNAAKHSGAERIDVFAEITAERAEVFVRDQGKGFDVDDVPADRLGVRDSIISRLERRGGTAILHSTIGQGTEVELAVPLPQDPPGAPS